MVVLACGVALGAGALAACAPCGFARLTAQVAAPVSGGSPQAGIRHGVRAAAAMAAGLGAFFGLSGVAAGMALAVVEPVHGPVTLIASVALLGLGAWLLTGRDLLTPVRCMDAHPLGSAAEPWSGYGMRYALGSLSCASAPLLAVAVLTAAVDAPVGVAVIVFLAYGAGMGTVVAVTSVAVAGGRVWVVRLMRSLLPHMSRASGLLAATVGIAILTAR